MFNSLFLLFSIALVISAFFVIFAQHPIFSLLFLVACFVFGAILLVFLECEFLGLLFIVIYAGAIVILFLFSVLMLETKLNNLIKNTLFYFPVGFIISLFLLIPLIFEISNFFIINSFDLSLYFNIYQNWYELMDSENGIQVYGQVLYSYYIFQFLTCGLILLLVIIGVISLTNIFMIQQSLDQSLFKQLSWNFKYIFNN